MHFGETHVTHTSFVRQAKDLHVSPTAHIIIQDLTELF